MVSEALRATVVNTEMKSMTWLWDALCAVGLGNYGAPECRNTERQSFMRERWVSVGYRKTRMRHRRG